MLIEMAYGYHHKCYECGMESVPIMTVMGPNFPHDPNGGIRHYCCLHCFWNWADRVIADRDKGGRLDRKVNWT